MDISVENQRLKNEIEKSQYEMSTQRSQTLPDEISSTNSGQIATPRGGGVASIPGADKVKSVLSSLWSAKKEQPTATTSKRVGGGFKTTTTSSGNLTQRAAIKPPTEPIPESDYKAVITMQNDLIQRKENDLQKAIQRSEASDKMLGQLKGEIAKYKEVQEDHAQDLQIAQKEIKKRDEMLAQKDSVIIKLNQQIQQMKIQFESELKKAKKINGALNSSIVNTEGNDTLAGNTLKGGKQKLN